MLRTRDLLNAGLTGAGITWRVKKRRLYRMHQGVYSVIPPEHLRIQGRWLAAVYACGDRAGLSHLPAAAHWDMAPIPGGQIDVTVPSINGRIHRPGIRIHRSRTLKPADITIHEGIPITAPARTLRDLRSRLPHKQFLAVLTRAERRGLDTGGLVSGTDPNRTRLEQRFLGVCRRHGIRLPQCEVIIGPYTVDFMWPDKALIVEVDGWQTHGTREAFESDRARDAWLTSQGHRVIRFTWRELHEDPTIVVITLIAILNPPSSQAA